MLPFNIKKYQCGGGSSWVLSSYSVLSKLDFEPLPHYLRGKRKQLIHSCMAKKMQTIVYYLK